MSYNILIYIYIYICVYICICICICICTCVCVFMYASTCMSLNGCVCTHRCTRKYIYIYISLSLSPCLIYREHISACVRLYCMQSWATWSQTKHWTHLNLYINPVSLFCVELLTYSTGKRQQEFHSLYCTTVRYLAGIPCHPWTPWARCPWRAICKRQPAFVPDNLRLQADKPEDVARYWRSTSKTFQLPCQMYLEKSGPQNEQTLGAYLEFVI